MRALALLIAGLWCAAAAALPPTTLAPSAVSGCLQPPAAERGVPEYPFELYKNDLGGRVKAALTLPGGPLGPAVTILEEQGNAGFAEPVRRYLRRLSAPCVPPGQSATLEFEFVFRPRDELVLVGGPVDPKDAARQRTAACLTHLAHKPTPDYPELPRRRGLQGRVHATLSFDGAGTPPQVRVQHRNSASDLAEAVRDWATGLRLPCYEGEPITLTQIHVFRLDDDVYGFMPLGLVQLMRSVKGIERQRITWNTHEMGCPFELRFTYLRPDAPNEIRQVGTPDLRRKPLIDWLTTAELATDKRSLDAIFADTADVAVPCTRFDLNPKE